MFRYLIRLINSISGVSLVIYASSAMASSAPVQYQIGEEWSRIRYNGQLTTTESLNNALRATARIDLSDTSGTAFYVGKYLGSHLMVTNSHVLSDPEVCRTGKIYFQSINKKFPCLRVIARFKELEVTFFTINVSKKNEYLLHPLKFDFKNEHQPGDKIVLAGHGSFMNIGKRITYDISSTCMIATSTATPLFIKVKSDDMYNAWSFVHACEVSHGDSGAALVSESSGKVIGINWATSERKPIILKNSSVVFDWIEKQNPRMWESLSLGVPNSYILNAVRQKNHPVLSEFLKANL